MNVAIVKYGMGNVASVQKTIKKLGFECQITDDHSQIKNSDVIILPGVGSFEMGMKNLKDRGLVEFLNKEVLVNKKPFIGICLGMQLLANYGTEPTLNSGLGWVEGEVVKIESPNNLNVPHLGWNNVKLIESNALFENSDQQDFYFIHSYHFVPKNSSEIALTVDYDGIRVAAIQKENIVGMQFHPEKSQDAGLSLLNKILNHFA